MTVPSESVELKRSKTHKFVLPFIGDDLCFSENYPEKLIELIPISEIDGVVRRINDEFRARIVNAAVRMRIWCCSTMLLTVFVIGVFGIVPSLYAIVKFRTAMSRFWSSIRVFFFDINRQIYLSRRIEWKLVKDKSKLEGRDVTFPILAYSIEIILKPKILPQPLDAPLTKLDVTAYNVSQNSETTIDDDFEGELDPAYLGGNQDLRESENYMNLNDTEQPSIHRSHLQDGVFDKPEKESIKRKTTRTHNVLSAPRRKEIESMARIENLLYISSDGSKYSRFKTPKQESWSEQSNG